MISGEEFRWLIIFRMKYFFWYTFALHFWVQSCGHVSAYFVMAWFDSSFIQFIIFMLCCTFQVMFRFLHSCFNSVSCLVLQTSYAGVVCWQNFCALRTRSWKDGKLQSAVSEELCTCVSLTLKRNCRMIGLMTNASRKCVIGVSSLRPTSLLVAYN